MGAMTDLFSAISKLRVSGLVRILSVSANCNRDTEGRKERKWGGKRRESVVSIIWNWRQNFFLDETTAAKREQISSDKSTEGAPIWILHGCHIKDSLLMYQNVIGPAFPGEVERCLLQLHDVLVPAVGPVLGSQLAYIGPKTESNNADIVLSHS